MPLITGVETNKLNNPANNPAMEEGFDDILGSGAVCKKVVRKAGGITPEFGQLVTIRYNGYLKDSGKEFARDIKKSFRLGEGEVIPALELVVRSMSVSEVALMNCDERFGYGETGFPPHVPPGATLKFEVELLEIGELRQAESEMTSEQCLKEANIKKESGNEWLSLSNYTKAISMYKSALKIMENWEYSEDLKDECRNLVFSISNNLSHAYLKIGNYKEAKKSCNEVLQVDEHNIKALYRLCRAQMMLDELDEASVSIQKAISVAPNDKKIRELREELREKRSLIKEKEKRMSVKMISGKTPKKTKETLKPLATSQLGLSSFKIPLVVAALAIMCYVVFILINS